MGCRGRLGKLGRLSLEYRRLRSDVLEVCTIMRGIDRVNAQDLSTQDRKIMNQEGMSLR